MPRAGKVLCPHCENRMMAGVSFCPHCGNPTLWATPEERTKWELEQWHKLKGLRAELMAEELGVRPGRRPGIMRRVARWRKNKSERLLREWQYSMLEYEENAPPPEMLETPDQPLPPETLGYIHELEGRIAALEHRVLSLENIVSEKTRRVPLFNKEN